MPLCESANLTYDQMKQKAQTLRCQCGAELSVAWGGAFGYSCYILRCTRNVEHSDFIRPAIISNYDLPGYNMPGIMNRREREMMQKYGEERGRAMVKIGGGNPIATLTQEGAAKMITLLYPDASKSESGKAAIIKGAMICRDYGLNPAMDHIFLIMFKKKEGDAWIPNWSVVRGIKASRLICAREKSYGYVDDTPRIMTQEEQERIFGEVDESSVVAICKLKDRDGNTFTGYGKWPRKKKDFKGNVSDNEPNGKDKGNSMFNMACIRAERQALDKLNPGAMPADVDVVDERFMPSNRVVVEEIKPETKQIEAGNTYSDTSGESQQGEESQQDQGENQEETTQEPSTESTGKQSTEKKIKPASEIKSFGDLYDTCMKQWPNTFKTKQDVLKEAGVGRQEDLTLKPSEVYASIVLTHL